VLAAIRHLVARPEQLQRVEGFVEDLCPKLGVGVLAETRELVVGSAQAHAESEAPAGEAIERHGLSGHHRHASPSQRRDHRADDDPLGRHGDGCEGDPRVDHRLPRLPADHVIPQEEAVPSSRLGVVGQRGETDRVGEIAAVGNAEPELRLHPPCAGHPL